MIDILFFIDFEKGHIFPTLKMAQNFVEQGYSVAYIGIVDTMKIVEEAGFKTFVVFEDIYPEGITDTGTLEDPFSWFRPADHIKSLIEGELDVIFQTAKPKLSISSHFVKFEALILEYKYTNINQIIFLPFLPNLNTKIEGSKIDIAKITAISCINEIMKEGVESTMSLISYLDEHGIKVNGLEDVVHPLTKLQHVIPCPKEFEFDDKFVDDKVLYLGPEIRKSKLINNDSVHQSLLINENKKTIYVSMGSQVAIYKEKANRIFRTIIECMKAPELQEYHLILSAGVHYSTYKDESHPNNVSLYQWVPQIELLEKTTLAIIHGGLGTVKECIFHAVPMIVVPMGRDQFDNAKRVSRHQLGIELNVENASCEFLIEKILHVVNDDTIKNGVIKMKNIFHEKEKEKPELSLLDAVSK